MELLSQKGSHMFTAEQYRAKASEYAKLAGNGGLVFQTLHPPRASLGLPGGPVVTSKAGYDDA